MSIPNEDIDAIVREIGFEVQIGALESEKRKFDTFHGLLSFFETELQ